MLLSTDECAQRALDSAVDEPTAEVIGKLHVNGLCLFHASSQQF